MSDEVYKIDERVPKVLIPMIRRTFPELIMSEIVGVQPMTGPTGVAFALRNQFGGILMVKDKIKRVFKNIRGLL